jgi:hypothetical protein
MLAPHTQPAGHWAAAVQRLTQMNELLEPRQMPEAQSVVEAQGAPRSEKSSSPQAGEVIEVHSV